MVPDSLARQILDSIGARAVAMKMGQQRRLLAVSDMPPHDQPRHRHARHAVASRHHRCVRHAALRRQRRDARGRARRRWAATSSRSCSTRRRCARRCCASRVNILLLSLLISGDHRDAGLSRAALSVGAADAAHHRQHDGVPRRPGKSRRASSRRPAAATRSASPSASSPPCSATSPRCCSRRAISPRSGSRCRRSTTTCATCWPRRSCSPTGWRACPTRTCSASRRS